MQRLLLHSTLVLFVVLLLAAACHAEQPKTSALAEGQKTDGANEERNLLEEEEEEDEEEEEEEEEHDSGAELALSDQKEKANLLLDAGSRMVRTGALESPSHDSELSDEAERQRQMAHRVRELLSRLPIIPLSQKPVLHKETLVAPALAPASAVLAAGPSDATTSTDNPNSTPVGQTAIAVASPAPARDAPATRTLAPVLLDDNAFVSDERTDKQMQRAPPASVTTLYGVRAPAQDSPAALSVGEQEDYLVPNSPLPYAERSGDSAEIPGTTGPQPGNLYSSLADLVRDEQLAVGAQYTVSPAEFVQMFDIMKALGTLLEWIENVKQELHATGPNGGTSEVSQQAGNAIPEELTEKRSGDGKTANQQGHEHEPQGGTETIRTGRDHAH